MKETINLIELLISMIADLYANDALLCTEGK